MQARRLGKTPGKMKEKRTRADYAGWLPSFPLHPRQDFVCGGRSYADVYAMAAHLQKLFTEHHLGNVCLATEDKAVIAAALLAALAGGTTLLLPNALSKRALVRLQNAAGFTAVIAERAEQEDILPEGAVVLWPEITTEKQFTADFDYKADLVRLFTGGTTGAPAIWSKSGENLVAEAVFLADFFHLTAGDNIVATVSPCHIYGLLFAVLLPLVSSASVAGDIPSFPAEISEVVENIQATILAAVPAHYRALRNQAVNAGPLRCAVSSAGMLDPFDNAQFCELNEVPVIEVYGSTETGGIATRSRFAGETLFSPFSTVDWKITDDSRLAVRSAYVSSQTLRDGDGFFVTNDRVEAEGESRFLLKGRVDTVIKVGGKRVDLDEICEAIKQQPGVEDCVVEALTDSGGRENRICALIQTVSVEIPAVRSCLQDMLEPYAVPRVIRIIEKIPMTAAGKYDHGAIRQLLS